MNQATYEATNAGASQTELVLRRLLDAPGGAWVPMPELARVSGAYAVHSRIADLRKAGWTIEQSSIREGRQVRSFYRLTTNALASHE